MGSSAAAGQQPEIIHLKLYFTPDTLEARNYYLTSLGDTAARGGNLPTRAAGERAGVAWAARGRWELHVGRDLYPSPADGGAQLSSGGERAGWSCEWTTPRRFLLLLAGVRNTVIYMMHAAHCRF